ncbi:MAG: hypothetical protein IPL99_29590 [Candidatus Competibacteraceae bacterium]|nr:hypothetical protein [Candidatus Competibacteraceae bacterium]
MQGVTLGKIQRPSLILIAVVIAPLIYCTVALLYAVNVPVGDDYALLGFMNDFHALSALSDKVILLLSFHNEHRIIVLRCVSLLVEFVFGSLDFRILILIGNVALLAALFQLGRTLDFGKDMFRWALLFLIVLQPQPQKLIFYPMAIIQAYMGLLFAVMYLRFLLEKKNFILSMLFYLMTILSTGSGVFLVIIGAPLLAYQKRRTEFIVHLMLFMIAAYLYFLGFLGNSSSRLGYLGEHPMQAVSFFLQLLGGISEPPMQAISFISKVFGDTSDLYYFEIVLSQLPTIIGFLLAAYFTFHLTMAVHIQSAEIKETYIKQLVFLCYCIMMLLLIVVGRTELYHDNLMKAALDGRYRIYGILFAAIVFIGVLHNFQSRGYLSVKNKKIVLLIALFFNIGWFSYRFDSIRYTAQHRTQAMRVYLATHDPSVLPIWAVIPEYAASNLDKAISSGVYKP